MALKFEKSAGGIVYKRSLRPRLKRSLRPAGLKKEDSQIHILLTKHSQHHGWVFPKGLIDPGEDRQTTAVREVKEEGGVEAKIVQEFSPIEYFYKLEGQLVKKKVTYFLMEYLSGDPADHDWEMEDAQWIPSDEVEGTLSFKSDKEIFRKARELLKK